MKKIRKLYPVIYNRRFSNYAGERDAPILTRSACLLFRTLWRRLRYNGQLDGWREPHPRIPRGGTGRCIITWIGHATFLLNMAGLNIITDPIFGNLSTLLHRVVPAGIAISDLPPIDVVLISHNHYDHMDEYSLCYLRDRNPHLKVLVPYGDKAWFLARGFTNVTEYAWWETTEITHADTSVRFTFLPAHHWSQRGVFDRNRTLWGSWMCESDGASVYFAGDTAYGPHFRNIAHFFPHIDVALMPVAPTEPREWMATSHILPEQAIEAFLELGARHFIPMHWGTFWIGAETPLCGIRETCAAWRARSHRLHDRHLQVMRFGQSCCFDAAQRTLESDGERISAEHIMALE